MSEFVENASVSLTDDLATESVDLSDLAEEPSGGPMQPGWYKSEIIEGYATRSGKQFLTSDEPSKNGDSRNLQLCFRVTPRTGEPRNLNVRINYRLEDLTPERIAYVKEAREQFRGVHGRWSDADVQRSSLALAQLGQLGKSVGFATPKAAQGNVNSASFIGKTPDIRLRIDKNNYNEVSEYAPSGTKTGGATKAAA